MLPLLCSSVLASDRDPRQPIGGPRNEVHVKSLDDFCIFLPPKPNLTIAQSEGYPLASPQEQENWAVSYCTKQNAANGARQFPPGLITGAHFLSTPVQNQISGTFDPKVLGIPLDGGGFYDFDQNVNSPPGGFCTGFDSFYNAVVPVDGIFCIKCCKGISGCNISNWQAGCEGMVPGSYQKGFTNEGTVASFPVPTEALPNPSPSSSPTGTTKNNAVAISLSGLVLMLLQ